MTTPNDRSVERAAFEKQILSQFPTVLPEVLLERSRSKPTYTSMLVEHAWRAWQASEREALEVVAVYFSQLPDTMIYRSEVAAAIRRGRATLERAEVGSVVPGSPSVDLTESDSESPEAAGYRSGIEDAISAINAEADRQDALGVLENDSSFKSRARLLRETALDLSFNVSPPTASGISPEALGSDDPKAGSGSTQAGREPLTDDRIELIAENCDAINPADPFWKEFAREIEAEVRALAPSSTPRD